MFLITGILTHLFGLDSQYLQPACLLSGRMIQLFLPRLLLNPDCLPIWRPKAIYQPLLRLKIVQCLHVFLIQGEENVRIFVHSFRLD